MIFTPLNKMRFPERIAKTIQMRILNGKFKYGKRLPPELILAKEFDVSRSVIREAMRILDGLGLIQIKKGPKGGTFVSNGYHKPLNNSLRGLLDSGRVNVEHIFMVRLLIEPNVAAEAALKATEEDMQELRFILEESEKQKDDALTIFEKMIQADAIVYASPLYCWSFTSQIKPLIDRHFCLVSGDGTPEHDSLISDKSAALLVTCAGPIEGNCDAIQGIFKGFTDYLHLMAKGNHILPFCTTPDAIGDEGAELAENLAKAITV